MDRTANIIIVFPKQEDAEKIRQLLVRSGYLVFAVCTSGGAALQAADRAGEGVIVSAGRLKDMMYDHLYEMLPGHFKMVLLSSARVIEEGVPEPVIPVKMPVHMTALVHAIDEAIAQLFREGRARKARGRPGDEERQKVILQAKLCLMERRGITEEEAHRYLQKTSMDSGVNLYETAQMILSLMHFTGN